MDINNEAEELFINGHKFENAKTKLHISELDIDKSKKLLLFSSVQISIIRRPMKLIVQKICDMK